MNAWIRRFVAAASLALALAVAGCGGDNSGGQAGQPGKAAAGSEQAGDASRNDVDVTFLTGMIPHHQQAIEMSDIVLGKRGVEPEVISLAERIKAAQGPEIKQMEEWLGGWGVERAAANAHGGHGGGSDGMMSEADMAQLRQADGSQATKLFLTGMIAHHQGAVRMAELEASQGRNADAKDLAERIIADQQAEIEEMRALLEE